MVNEATQSTFV